MTGSLQLITDEPRLHMSVSLRLFAGLFVVLFISLLSIYPSSPYLADTVSLINDEPSQHVPVVQVLHGRDELGTCTYLRPEGKVCHHIRLTTFIHPDTSLTLSKK